MYDYTIKNISYFFSPDKLDRLFLKFENIVSQIHDRLIDFDNLGCLTLLNPFFYIYVIGFIISLIPVINKLH